jgi:hypothetical protein
MKINKKYIYIIKMIFLVILILSYVSCRNDVDYLFNKLITIEKNYNENVFPSIDLQELKNINNKYYRQLYKKGKSINEYLLTKAYSEKITNWYNYPFYFQMKEGDIAIKLLLDINIGEYDFHKIIPNEILEEYNKNGARVWWDCLHKNREKVIKLIKENI